MLKLLGNPMKKYRKMILAGETPDESTVKNAGLLLSDPQKDAATLQRRRECAKRLEQSKAMAEEAAAFHVPSLREMAAKPLDQFETVGELAVHFEEMAILAGRSDPRRTPAITAAAQEKARLEMAARQARAGSTEQLIKTADAAIHSEVESAEKQIAQYGAAIGNRLGTKRLAARIATEVARSEQLSAGEPSETARGELAECRQRLEKLRSDPATQRAEANDKVSEGESLEILKLQKVVVEARAAMLIPENLRWAIDGPLETEGQRKRRLAIEGQRKPEQSPSRVAADQEKRRESQKEFAELVG